MMKSSTWGSDIISKFIFIAWLLIPCALFADEVYQQPAKFIEEVFGGEISPPKPLYIYLTGKRRKVVAEILQREPSMLRVRYWKRGKRSAWILNEIGKTKPITVGIVVNKGRIADLRILIYRESHGAEVRHRFFTKQFVGSNLDKAHRLTVHVDGISGATLSVYAVQELAALALYFDRELRSE